jgi:hypothetical protein
MRSGLSIFSGYVGRRTLTNITIDVNTHLSGHIPYLNVLCSEDIRVLHIDVITPFIDCPDYLPVVIDGVA